MEVLVLLIFISVIMVLGVLSLFIYSYRNADFNHFEQLSLQPLEEESNANHYL